MMARLLAEIRNNREELKTNQAKADANQAKRDATLREMKAGQQHLKEEIMAKLDSQYERMTAGIDSLKVKIGKAIPVTGCEGP
jgi:predicted  nucleic acid-binding Zn-ribbon protein